MKPAAFGIKSSKGIVYVFFIVLLGLAIYANILNSPFQFDDYTFIVGNPVIKDVRHLFARWEEPAIEKRKVLTFLTFAMNYYWGQENTFGYHLVNVILHITTALLLFYVVKLLFDLPVLRYALLEKDRDIFALFAALIFLTHPLQTQAVTYIWERSEVLSAWFYLLSYLFYLLGRLKGNSAWYGGALFVFYVGFFAKGTIITLPFLVILTELILLNLPLRKKYLLSGVLLVTIAGLIILWSTGILTGILKALHLSFLLRDPSPHFYGQYFLTQLRVVLLYVRLVFFPFNQNLDYDFPFSNSFFEQETFWAAVGLAAIAAFAVSSRQKNKLITFGILWFFIYLIPTSSGIALLEPVQEHRLYLSVAGFAIFLVALLFQSVPWPKPRIMLLGGIIAALSLLTVARNDVWTSRETLMQDTIRKSPNNPRPYFVLGSIYFQQERWEEAAQLYRRAIKLNPYYPDPHNNLGLIYIKRGEYREAQEEFRTAMSADSRFIHAYINMGYLASLQKKNREAEEYFLKSLSNPHRFTLGIDKAAVMLGGVYLAENRLPETKTVLNKALVLNPYNERAYFGLGTVYLLENNYPLALEMYKKAVKINPQLSEGYMQIGVTYYVMNDYKQAIEFYEQALKVDSRWENELFLRLAEAYRKIGNNEKAEFYYQQK